MDFPSSEQLKKELEELTGQMSDPVVQKNPEKMKELSRQHRDKSALRELVQQLEGAVAELADVGSLLTAQESDIRQMAVQDETRLTRQREELMGKIEEALLPRDPRDNRDVILEIRSGAGGEEAALFASELFRAYTRFAEAQKWSVHVLHKAISQESGGFKEVVAEISGQNVFGTWKFERGVHRVQRVPATEKMGRIHTSTITVAVLPQAEEVDLEINPKDLRIDTYRASGAGGQHVNKTSSAIRITHLPTNTVVAVQDERSQHKNREKAMKVLRSRLLEAQEEKQRSQEAAERKSQVGTGDRSEKVRTYNFPQDRITDHRIKESWSNIEGVMGGQMEPIFRALKEAEKAALLKRKA